MLDVKGALVRLQKKGGCVFLGFQSIFQMEGLYGAEAHTIIENCNTKLLLRCHISQNVSYQFIDWPERVKEWEPRQMPAIPSRPADEPSSTLAERALLPAPTPAPRRAATRTSEPAPAANEADPSANLNPFEGQDQDEPLEQQGMRTKHPPAAE